MSREAKEKWLKKQGYPSVELLTSTACKEMEILKIKSELLKDYVLEYARNVLSYNSKAGERLKRGLAREIMKVIRMRSENERNK